MSEGESTAADTDGDGVGDRRRGAVHLYDGDGAWSGFFVSEEAAAAWVRTHPGYTVSDVAPTAPR